MSRNWHFCVGSEPQLREVVRARFAHPLFVEADPGDATHTIEIADNMVCEHGTGLGTSLLPARLAAATREPVTSVIGMELPHAIQTEPDGSVLSAEPMPKPFDWRPTTTLWFAEDPDERWRAASRYFAAAAEYVAGLFPIRARLARLDCKQAKAYGGCLNGHVQCEIQLAIYKPVGEDKELLEMRTESVELCNLRWRPGLVLDEQIAGFEKSLRRWIKELKHRLAETTDWSGITPKRLLDV